LLAIAGVAGAAGFLLQPLFETREPSGPDTSLSDAADVEFAPRGLEPVGDIPRAPTVFVWTQDPLAARYRFELRGAKGAPLHEAVVTDTVLVLPAGLVDWNIVAGGAWRVTSIRRDGREAVRAPVPFRIASP
jgi:hypothetical protein